MSELVITREDLIKSATAKLFSDSSIAQIMKDSAHRFYEENALLGLDVAASMMDVSVRTLTEIAGDKIVRLGPRIRRISAQHIKELTQAI